MVEANEGMILWKGRGRGKQGGENRVERNRGFIAFWNVDGRCERPGIVDVRDADGAPEPRAQEVPLGRADALLFDEVLIAVCDK